MKWFLWPAMLAGLLSSLPAWAQHQHDDGHEMQFDTAGMVMNANRETLPENCSAIGADVEWTIRAGRKFAVSNQRRVFGYDQSDFHVEGCTRITVHFYNEDEVRHQWMLHGLPRTLYPEGMFHLEANGGQHVMGTFIVPADDATYLVHCDIPQHMEKGMKAQVVVGSGRGDLWSVPGITADFNVEEQVPRGATLLVLVAFVGGALGLAYSHTSTRSPHASEETHHV